MIQLCLQYESIEQKRRNKVLELGTNKIVKGILSQFLCIFITLLTTCSASVTRDKEQNVASLPHARLSQACADTFSGLEGQIIKDFTLERVFIVVTPGHTSTSLVGDSPSPCDVLDALERHKSAKVRAYPEVLSLKKSQHGKDWKHGFATLPAAAEICFDERRADLKNRYSKNARNREAEKPKKFSGGVEKGKHKFDERGGRLEQGNEEVVTGKQEELSVLGIIQKIGLGEYLAKTYFHKLKSLDNYSYLSDSERHIAVAGSNQVLFQTMNALLYGLLTEKHFVHAQIAKLNANFCQSERGDSLSKCQTAEETQKHLQLLVQEAFEKETLLLKNSRHSDVNIASVIGHGNKEDVTAKNAITHIAHSVCNKRNYVMGKDEEYNRKSSLWTHFDLDLLFSTSDAHTSYLTSSKLFQTFAKTHSNLVLHKMDSFLNCNPPEGERESHCQEGDDLKLVSVDSLSMLGLLSALSIEHSQHILPASRLVFEVYHFQHSNNYSSGKDSDLIFNAESPRMMEPLASGHFSSPTSAGISAAYLVSPEIREHQYAPKSKLFLATKYVRVLLDGHMITSLVGSCSDDPMIGLGLCAYSTLKDIIHLGDGKIRSGQSNIEPQTKRLEL